MAFSGGSFKGVQERVEIKEEKIDAVYIVDEVSLLLL